MQYFRYILLFAICFASYTAYDYLQVAHDEMRISQDEEPLEPSSFRSVNQSNDGFQEDTPKPDSSSRTKEQQPSEEEAQGILPDVEFLKFLFEKSKEGIPVLRIGDYLK